MVLIRKSLLVVGLLALSGMSASAQVPTGTPPFGTFSTNGAPDVIDLANLNSHIAVPVLHKAGRGTDFTYDLSYDSSVWYPVVSGSTTSWQPVYNWGWRAQTETATGYVSYTSTYYSSGGPHPCWTRYYYYTYHDPLGGTHLFSGSVEVDGPNNYYCTGDFWPLNNKAADGSGYSIAVDTACCSNITVYSRDGKVINVPISAGTGAGTSIDRNGNEITVDGSGHFYDTLSSTTPVLTVAAPAPPSSATFTYTAPSGATPSYTMKYGTYTVQTNFGCSGVTDFGPTIEYLVNEIDLPDGSKYLFTYEGTPGHSGNYTGRLASVTLPTSGTITYTYTGGSSGHIMCADGSASGLQRQIYDGTNTNTWTYSRSGTVPATTTTILDPQGNQTVSNFSGLYETQSQVYQGTSTLLETLLICYNNNFSNCATATVTTPITKRDVYTTLPNLANPALSETTYDSFGDLTEDKEIDFVPNTNGSPYLSDTIIGWSYVNTVNAYRQTTTVKNNAGTIVSQTSITFDVGTPQATSGTPQHTTPAGARGNPTTISYLIQGSTNLNKTFTYYDTGNVMTAKDVNGAQESITYGACGNSFSTSINEPLSLSRSMTWNCSGGVETSATDENGKTVSAAYTDPYFWRPSSTTDQLGNQTNFTYTGQTQIESAMNFNGATSTSDALVTLDGLGRAHINQTKQGQSSSTYDSVETDYDALGRPYKVTVPYNASAGQLCSGTCNANTTTYDALGRPLTVTDAGGGTVSYTYSQNDIYQSTGPAPTGENVKRRQLEYDGLGRLTSACEITGATGSGSCAQNSGQIGYWTKYTYDANGNLTGVTQNAQSTGSQQTRSYSYDDLSRMTAETNPESGTTTYVYDSSSTCNGGSNFPGDLTEKHDAAGNLTCFFYDILHRLYTVWVPSGPGQSGISGCKRFFYDNTNGTLGSKPSGVSVSNTLGRLTEAETDTCAWPVTQSSLLTDEWFSYTARGQTSDAYESTPHSGGYYHSSSSYWPNGALNVLTNSPTGYYLAFGLDGEGRGYSTTDSGGSHPLASTVYNAASQPTQLNFGYSGDSDSYNYDPTGRMTQYQFNVGPLHQALTGNLTWNANGSLQNLNVQDLTNNAGTQSCSYQHDDLVRITTANCPGSQTSNPGFEQGLTNWTTWNNPVVVTNAANAHSGSNYLQLTANPGSGSNAMSQIVAVQPGQQLTFGGWVNLQSGTGGDPGWWLQILNANQTPINWVGPPSPTSSGWTYQVATYVVPAGVAYVQLYAQIYLPTTSTVVWVDDGFLDGASIWNQTFSYDAFGNINKTGNSSFNPSYSASTNRMTQIGSCYPSYDADGEVLNDCLNSYTWDAYGRPLTVYTTGGTNVGVTYDALGRIVEQNRNGAFTQMMYSPTGFLMLLMNGQSFQKSFAPMPGGGATVWQASPSLVYYRHADWQGSSRFATTSTRTVYFDGAYAPFGEPYATSGTADYSYTGMDQDTSANVYDFPAREYGIQGRWPSPDPAGLDAVDPSNPQSWNRYGYVLNNPLYAIDPSGLDPCPPDTPTSVCVSANPPGGGGVIGGDGAGNGQGGGAVGPSYCGGGAGTTTCGKSDSASCVAEALANHRSPAACTGGSVSGAAPGTPQTTKTPGQCVADFSNTNAGWAAKFASPLSLIPGWNSSWKQSAAETIFLTGGKVAALKLAEAGSTTLGATTTYSITTGVTTTTASQLGTVLGVTEAVAGKVAPIVAISAALVDIGAHSRCQALYAPQPTEVVPGP
jgi:RHS repeat-associated protein